MSQPINTENALTAIGVLLSNLSFKGVEIDTLNWICQNPTIAGYELQKFLQNGAKSVNPSGEIVTVIRKVKAPIPAPYDEFVYPQIQALGPSEYSLRQVETSTTPAQRMGNKEVTGSDILEYILKNEGITDHLTIHDAIEIYRKGIHNFDRFFSGKTACFFGSIVKEKGTGNIFVPVVYTRNCNIYLRFINLETQFSREHVILRFPKGTCLP